MTGVLLDAAITKHHLNVVPNVWFLVAYMNPVNQDLLWLKTVVIVMHLVIFLEIAKAALCLVAAENAIKIFFPVLQDLKMHWAQLTLPV
jgi:hypothetical protein